MAGKLVEKACNRSFGGLQKVFQHESNEVKCMMTFGIFLPPQIESKKCPVLYYLSGLTCTEQNVVTKGGFQRAAARHGIVVVCPDTSPRGLGIEGEDDSYDFGSGAGFYLDATEDKWKTNYRMYSYVTKELPALIRDNFNVTSETSVTGHSMGGFGALMCGLKNPNQYRSISAFSPIVNPINCPWGQKAFKGYLGTNADSYLEYDPCHLIKKYSGPVTEILIDQGSSDQFFKEQLKSENFVEACKGTKVTPKLRMQEGYDHSYFFISTFMEDHIDFHAKYLCSQGKI
ncbi:S-formylglutathione hydrolase-like [Styela clava]|uniref:S-formylglutathione hydrolase-like n=1 Tax=Styela clava TaxID=7725 RepID=UPI0019398DEF|nr:S-formylglutathione hydrolase-like [Styela clava]